MMVSFLNQKTLLRSAFGLWCSDRPDAGIVAASVRDDPAGRSASVLLGHAGCTPASLVATASELLRAADEGMRTEDADAYAEAIARVAQAQTALGFQSPEVLHG